MKAEQPADDVLSEAERRFDEVRRRAGLFLAPLVMLALWFAPLSGLTTEAHRLLAVLGLVVTLWITEALPLPVTALLGPALCVLAGVGSAREVFEGFARPLIFVFIGSLILAQAVIHHGLNRRFAVSILALRWVGDSPRRLLLVFGLITGAISMWMSNTAVAAMMCPIALAILEVMQRGAGNDHPAAQSRMLAQYGTCLMLAVSFMASAGGLATPVGTMPNLLAVGLLEKSLHLHITFFRWLYFGFPLALGLLGFLTLYLAWLCPRELRSLPGTACWLAEEKTRLGRWTRGEVNVLIAFGVTVTLWILPGLVAWFSSLDHPVYHWLRHRLPSGVAALLGATLLFVLPVNWRKGEFTLQWRQAQQIDWGTILLFGGGLALGDQMFASGLSRWIGEVAAGSLNVHTNLALIALFTVLAVLVSEITSNTAAAAMLVPVAISVAQAAGVPPLQPALAACLGSSLGFMLPVSTPPNAIVYSTARVPLLKMARYGLVVDVAGSALIMAVVYWLVPSVF